MVTCKRAEVERAGPRIAENLLKLLVDQLRKILKSIKLPSEMRPPNSQPIITQ